MDRKSTILTDLLAQSMKNSILIFADDFFTQLQVAINDPDTPVSKIASIIEKDPGLTSSVLKTANSSFYGLSRKVGTIKQAITILGFNTLKNIMLTLTVKHTFVKSNHIVSENLWKHSLASAIAAKHIISINFHRLGDQAFIAGLLHDFGKFVLINFKDEQFKLLVDKLRKQPYQYSTDLEMETFGVDHQDVGDFFSQRWLLPDTVTNSIKHHHDLENAKAHNEFVASVALANNIAKAMEMGRSTSGLVEFLPHWVYSLLGIGTESFEYIVTKTKQEYAELTKTVG